jgi:chemotaxis family two-component system response regulator Rcp1
MSTEVLLIDDSEGDVRLTREALHESRLAINLSVATDGVDGLAYLRREGIHADAPRPALILLDLNMPRMDGRELLACIKADATPPTRKRTWKSVMNFRRAAIFGSPGSGRDSQS